MNVINFYEFYDEDDGGINVNFFLQDLTEWIYLVDRENLYD